MTSSHCVEGMVFVKGIGLQRLSLNSEERGWRDYNFATNLMKIR